MTARELVLQRCPDAKPRRGTDDGIYIIHGKLILGIGATEEAAWENARVNMEKGK